MLQGKDSEDALLGHVPFPTRAMDAEGAWESLSEAGGPQPRMGATGRSSAGDRPIQHTTREAGGMRFRGFWREAEGFINADKHQGVWFSFSVLQFPLLMLP